MSKEVIYQKSLALLAFREHSRRELELKLLQRGYLRSDVLEVLDRLKAECFQSDMRFAENYVYVRSFKGYGPDRIRLELRQRGVDEGLIDSAIKNTEIDWEALAQKVYNKKFGQVPAKDLREKIKRQQFMRYRGYQ